MVSELCKAMDITSAYHPQTNGLTGDSQFVRIL